MGFWMITDIVRGVVMAVWSVKDNLIRIKIRNYRTESGHDLLLVFGMRLTMIPDGVAVKNQIN